MKCTCRWLTKIVVQSVDGTVCHMLLIMLFLCRCRACSLTHDVRMRKRKKKKKWIWHIRGIKMRSHVKYLSTSWWRGVPSSSPCGGGASGRLEAVRIGGAISMNDFSAGMRYRLQGAWREVESVDPGGNSNKLATYQAWFATPFACNASQTYVPLPWYLFSGFA
eukprot:1145760-Pelagomonas_calceolata.AAC.1